MTNEELVELIQSGDNSKLPELWEQVRRFVWREAIRRVDLSSGMGGVTAEDLYQSGYIALLSAVDSFDPAAGRSFVSWLSLALKTQFAAENGPDATRRRKGPGGRS